MGLYEMSSGNNTIEQIVWHKESGSLFAASDTGIYSSWSGNSRDSEEWPEDAVHDETYFPKRFDVDFNDIFRYRFGVETRDELLVWGFIKEMKQKCDAKITVPEAVKGIVLSYVQYEA